MLRESILLLKRETDLLSLIFFGEEFQMEAPLYIKRFFILTITVGGGVSIIGIYSIKSFQKFFVLLLFESPPS